VKAAILAAGDGTRLRKGMPDPEPKPLFEVRGKSLIERTVEQLIAAGAESLAVIVNEQSLAVRDRIVSLRLPVPVDVVVRSTPSSMHSLLVLRPYLEGRDAMVSMVDSILPPGAVAAMAAEAAARPAQDSDATLVLTSYVDDEKPLCARVRGDRITELGTNLEAARWVTAGIYYFRPGVWPELDLAAERGVSKMRNFLALLLERGLKLHGHRLPKAVDVDRPGDLKTAEEYVALWERNR